MSTSWYSNTARIRIITNNLCRRRSVGLRIFFLSSFFHPSNCKEKMDKYMKLNVGDIHFRNCGKKYTYIYWEIKDFFVYCNTNYVYFSRPFWYYHAWWKLVLRPNIFGNKRWIQIGLRKMESPLSNHRLFYEFEITGLDIILSYSREHRERRYTSYDLYSEKSFLVQKPQNKSKRDFTISCILRGLCKYNFIQEYWKLEVPLCKYECLI